VVVSTEDEKIAEVSKKFGAEIIKRPNYLATDTAKTIDVFSHTLKFFSKKNTFPM
jgi:CMP-N,N'-diacetyllegionaminic acid synthase